MRGHCRHLPLAITLFVLTPAMSSAADIVRAGGTGMALGFVERIGEAITKSDPNLRVEVLPSLGTPGGLRALADGAVDVALTGRVLTAKERDAGAIEAVCLITPLIFATSHAAPAGLSLASLPAIYRDPAPRWADGAPLKVILRARSGSENQYLANAVSGLGPAIDLAYDRSGAVIATTDQENAAVAQRTAGSLAIMTLLQVHAERLDLRQVPLDGVAPSPEALVAKTYPLRADVCLALPKAPSAAATRLVAFIKSESGRALVQTLGAALAP